MAPPALTGNTNGLSAFVFTGLNNDRPANDGAL